jgi:hypothetical protein
MLIFFMYIFTSYLFVQFFFSIGYAVAIMFKETDVNKRDNKMLKHIGVATASGAVALYFLLYLLRTVIYG